MVVLSNLLQGYAARGEPVLTVTLLFKAVLPILATQIPLLLCSSLLAFCLRYANYHISLRSCEFVPLGTAKRKNTTHGGVFLFGAPSGIRTRDPLIKSQLLYQLS